MIKQSNIPDEATLAQIAADKAAETTARGIVTTLNNELSWLDSTIPTIDVMTTAQVRNVVKRLAQENQGILRVLLWLAKSK